MIEDLFLFPIFFVCAIGKTALMSALTGTQLESVDMLFQTLNNTIRRVDLPSGHPALLCDTIGFISDLPHVLVDAFHTTLEEVSGDMFVSHCVCYSV